MAQSKHYAEKKASMRTSRDVYHRIRWDSSQHQIEASSTGSSATEAAASNAASAGSVRWTIGFEDRFLGMQEMPVEQFIIPEAGGEIPWHRYTFSALFDSIC